MKLTDTTSQLCPYTGLRSFTEEESLYFKGRDEQVDQVTAQLEERKFLMLTGASGEGKSSLIYAGLIPNARAGFFKARYANWTVVDFRPERSPVSNMANALADKFPIQAATIETEMRRGFSSLVDLYLNADLYIDEKEESWKELPEQDKKSRARNASNLLILVDQFEEFFTNPENYHNETPSQDSQIVVNLILETSKIALQQNLPIYVVCTMRSDYIGQCSSFRGLPEYIGYSQFFVPRLKRKELKQVIEEPARFSGNRITQRLTERLVYDLSEGVDQLPILQHALSQVWLMASHGAEEMDLIHYAMVGGMPADELPAGDLARFETWFKDLPEYEQKFYAETGLNKVIENHASRLYESASACYNAENPGNPISPRDARIIIALTFSCLTKIDNSRAVRNRMTLQEITDIINRPELTPEIVGKVLNIFREEGNSFIRPFKTEDPSTHILTANTVLDITHESLIRNWGMLHKWASKEYAYYSTFLDLKKQLERWKEHGKSQGYLLPIGPLTYFENWYATCKPNVAWIHRYTERNEDDAANWKYSENLLQDIREFLKRSARHVMVSRAFLKYGAMKIVTFSAIAVLLVLCGFYWYDADQKKNENIVSKARKESHLLLASREISNESKANYLVAEERLTAASAIPYLQTIQNTRERVSLAVETYKRLMLYDKKFNGAIKQDLVRMIADGFTSLAAEGKNPELRLEQFNKFILLLAYDNYYNPIAGSEKILRDEASTTFDLLLAFFKNKQLYRASVSANLNQALQNWLAFGNASESQIAALLDMISPLSNPEAKSTFDVFYPKGSFEPNGLRPTDFNGGYHTLASLYAATGDAGKVAACFDQLRVQPDYFTDRLFNNYSNIIGYFYQFGHRASVAPLVKTVSSKYSTYTPDIIYRDLMIRSGYLSLFYRINFQIRNNQFEPGVLHPNLCLAPHSQFNAIAEDYEKSLTDIKDPAQRDFLLAMHYKRKAVFEHKYSFDRGIPFSQEYLNGLFDQAWNHFSRVKDNVLQETVSISYLYFSGDVRTKEVTRRQLFLYPDYMGGLFSLNYHSDIFLKYLSDKSLLDEAYKTPDDLSQIQFWVTNAFEQKPIGAIETMFNRYPLSDSSLVLALEFATHHPSGKDFDANLLVMVLANRAFQRSDTATGMRFYRRFRFQDIQHSANRYESLHKTFFVNQMMQLSKNLAMTGKVTEAVRIAEEFEGNVRRIIAYTYGVHKMYDHDYDPNTFILLDSALSKAERENRSRPEWLEYRYKLIYSLYKIGGEKMMEKGVRIFRTLPEGRKFTGTKNMVEGNAARGDYHNAMMSIPATLTEEQDLQCRTIILWQAAIEKEKESQRTDWAGMDQYYDWDRYVLFFGFQ